MFWIVTAAVLGAVLLGAWFYDRRHGVDPTRMPSDARRAQAEADADATRRNTARAAASAGSDQRTCPRQG